LSVAGNGSRRRRAGVSLRRVLRGANGLVVEGSGVVLHEAWSCGPRNSM
jgi:hypothetical protein